MTTPYHDSVEPLYYHNSSVFLNLLNIKNQKELINQESDITTIRSIELLSKPEIIKQSFDFNQLKAIHKHLFQDIYSWAGKPRSYDMRKDFDEFTPANKLPYYEQEVFEYGINFTELKNRPSFNDAAIKLAKCIGIINIFHPFPEGNGRAQRIFLSMVSLTQSFSLDWTKVQSWEMMLASKNAHQGNYEAMQFLIEKILIYGLILKNNFNSGKINKKLRIIEDDSFKP